MRDLNWKKIATPFLLCLHPLANVIYYYKWFFEFDSREWGCYFHIVQQVMIAILCGMMASIRKRTAIEAEFLKIAVIYNLLLAVIYLYRQLTDDKDSSNCVLLAISLILFIWCIGRSAVKYRYFVNDKF